jgi:hypothetical protein
MELIFKIGPIKRTHSFFVVENINGSAILGRDFLIQNGVGLYDLIFLRIGNHYIT